MIVSKSNIPRRTHHMQMTPMGEFGGITIGRSFSKYAALTAAVGAGTFIGTRYSKQIAGSTTPITGFLNTAWDRLMSLKTGFSPITGEPVAPPPPPLVVKKKMGLAMPLMIGGGALAAVLALRG